MTEAVIKLEGLLADTLVINRPVESHTLNMIHGLASRRGLPGPAASTPVEDCFQNEWLLHWKQSSY